MHFRNEAAEFVYVRSYSRWIEDLNRRETWQETVKRFTNFIEEERGEKIPKKVLRKIEEAMLSFDVMPSMRAVWSAGVAAKSDNTAMYNCSFQVIDRIEAFAECLYILMCGTGYGFSVEAEHVNKLPMIEPMKAESAGTFVIEDSKAGWADSLKYLMYALYSGKDAEMDYSKIRKKGERLKTMGGRASGPEPLIILHNFIRETFNKAQGRKLTTLECHDICNQIAEIVVVGGVRRSSEISLSNLSDQLMRDAKVWPFPMRRIMANNSAIYKKKPSAVEFLSEWGALAASGTGERGIFNLEGARARSPERRDSSLIMGTNPCAEILLRSMQFCNLSEIVVRAEDDLDSLLEKVETATWIGVIQSTFTNFPYLSSEWRQNCEDERLLGVSITGQMDNPSVLTAEALKAMKARAIKVAKRAAKVMGVNMPTAITCVKPSGTVSQLVDSASGLHTRHFEQYIRRYRVAATDPLVKLLRASGMLLNPENGERQSDWDAAREIFDKGLINYKDKCPIFDKDDIWSEDKVRTWVVSFPVKSPDNCITRHHVSAIQQLEHYKLLQENWCEHNASATIYVKDDEWFEVGNWVYKNWDIINGVSFLPHDGGKYEQTPYEDISLEEYEFLAKMTPKIDYSRLGEFETEDGTEGAKTLACAAGICEI